MCSWPVWWSQLWCTGEELGLSWWLFTEVNLVVLGRKSLGVWLVQGRLVKMFVTLGRSL